jgi:hypothetical protein
MTSVTLESISLRKIALPAEHGGWGIVLEPAILGLAVVPSGAGIPIGLAALLAFLARQPLKLAANDLRKKKIYPRTRPALAFAAAYGGGALLMITAAVALAGSSILLPFLFAAPFALVQLHYDARNESRSSVAEIAGCVAMGSVASSIAIAGGWQFVPAMVLWLLMLCRSIPAVLYVRSRLRMERGKAAGRFTALASHLLAVVAAAIVGPLLSALAMILLTTRAVVGLSPLRKRVRPQVIGYTEISWGVVTLALIAVGYHFSL